MACVDVERIHVSRRVPTFTGLSPSASACLFTCCCCSGELLCDVLFRGVRMPYSTRAVSLRRRPRQCPLCRQGVDFLLPDGREVPKAACADQAQVAASPSVVALTRAPVSVPRRSVVGAGAV